MHIWFWAWIAIAVILSATEIFSSGLYVLPFAIGAALAALLEFVWPNSISWQWAAFVGLSSVLTVVIQRRARRAGRDSARRH